MAKQVSSLVAILLLATIGWTILGSTTTLRTEHQDAALRPEVGQLWGTLQRQKAPELHVSEVKVGPGSNDSGQVSEPSNSPWELGQNVGWDASKIEVALTLDHRKKGLLWYSTYGVRFQSRYVVTNPTQEPVTLTLSFEFPVADGVFDNFALKVDGDTVHALNQVAGVVKHKLELAGGQQREVAISYGSQGLDQWWYMFGKSVTQIRDFELVMQTDFDDINFPENCISPTEKVKTSDGWQLTWKYESLVTGLQIGMEMPQRINPGPFVSRVSFFAPVSLLFFFFVMFVLTTVKKVFIHPINYAFVAAAFFAFHLLLAYLADHIDIHLAAAISSAVSIFLVISYLRLVVGMRFALVEAGLSQFVFLIGFSYAFFLKGFTGLAITICAILTLYVTMQYTAKLDWTKQGQERK